MSVNKGNNDYVSICDSNDIYSRGSISKLQQRPTSAPNPMGPPKIPNNSVALVLSKIISSSVVSEKNIQPCLQITKLKDDGKMKRLDSSREKYTSEKCKDDKVVKVNIRQLVSANEIKAVKKSNSQKREVGKSITVFAPSSVRKSTTTVEGEILKVPGSTDTQREAEFTFTHSDPSDVLRNNTETRMNLSEKDRGALKLGRLLLSTVLNKPEVTTYDSISRFFFDAWLSQSGSSVENADAISINILSEFQVN